MMVILFFFIAVGRSDVMLKNTAISKGGVRPDFFGAVNARNSHPLLLNLTKPYL